MTDDLRVLVETAMAAKLPRPLESNDVGMGHRARLLIAKNVLDAALSVRGPSGTPALIDLLMEEVYVDRDGVLCHRDDGRDLAKQLTPVFVVRTEEETP